MGQILETRKSSFNSSRVTGVCIRFMINGPGGGRSAQRPGGGRCASKSGHVSAKLIWSRTPFPPTLLSSPPLVRDRSCGFKAAPGVEQQQHWHAFQYASNDLQNDETLAIAAVRSHLEKHPNDKGHKITARCVGGERYGTNGVWMCLPESMKYNERVRRAAGLDV